MAKGQILFARNPLLYEYEYTCLLGEFGDRVITGDAMDAVAEPWAVVMLDHSMVCPHDELNHVREEQVLRAIRSPVVYYTKYLTFNDWSVPRETLTAALFTHPIADGELVAAVRKIIDE